MKILIIGASRGIGKALMEEALNDGHDVSVLARHPEKISFSHPKLTIHQGDVRDPASLVDPARDRDVLCSCVGGPITCKPVDLFSTAATTLVETVAATPGQKLIAVTGIGAGDSKGHGGFLYDKIFNPLLLKTIYADKDREEAIISASSVEWLIVRPAGLTNGPRTGTYRVLTALDGVTSKRISRRDVADFILTQAAEPTLFGKTPLITY